MLPEILAAEPARALTLFAVFGLGFAGNMTCPSLWRASRFGGAIGAVMMIA